MCGKGRNTDPTTAWLALDTSPLCRSWPPRASHCSIPLIWNFQNPQIHRDRMPSDSCPQSLGSEKVGRDYSVGAGAPFWDDKNTLNLIEVVVLTRWKQMKCH